MKKRTDHFRVKGEPIVINRYSQDYINRTDTCDTCGFHQSHTLNKNRRPSAWSIEQWEIHADVFDLEPLTLRRVDGSGALLGRIHRMRGKPNELWAFHSLDPDLPTGKGYMANVVKNRDEVIREPITNKASWEFRDIPWFLIHPWMLYKVNQNGGRHLDTFKRREEAMMKAQDILTKEALKGYRIETADEVEALANSGVDAPLADMVVYLDRFLQDALDAKTVKQVHGYLNQIEHMRNQLATVDELEETLRARLMGGLLDL